LARAAALRKQPLLSSDSTAVTVQAAENVLSPASAPAPPSVQSVNGAEQQQCDSMAALADAMSDQLNLSHTDSCCSPPLPDGEGKEPTGCREVEMPLQSVTRRRRIVNVVDSSSSEDEDDDAADMQTDVNARASLSSHGHSPTPLETPGRQHHRWRQQISSSGSDDDENVDGAHGSNDVTGRHDNEAVEDAKFDGQNELGATSSEGEGEFLDSADTDRESDHEGGGEGEEGEDDSFIVPDSDDDSFIVNDESDDCGDDYSDDALVDEEEDQHRKAKKTKGKQSRTPMSPVQPPSSANGSGGGSGIFNTPSFNTPSRPTNTGQWGTGGWTATPAVTKAMPYTTPKPAKQLKEFAKKREQLALSLYVPTTAFASHAIPARGVIYMHPLLCSACAHLIPHLSVNATAPCKVLTVRPMSLATFTGTPSSIPKHSRINFP
jgi:hypothetical protein